MADLPLDGPPLDNSGGDAPADGAEPLSPAEAARRALLESMGMPDLAGPTPGDAHESDDTRVAEAEAAVAADLSELEVLQHERDEYLDALRRLQADFENYKKRIAKQQSDLVERAAQNLVDKLLPVLDAADLALAHGAGEAVAQVAGLLMDILLREGLAGVDPKPGEAFDPTVHEAVAHEAAELDEDGPPEVTELLRAGYRWNNVLLRPAMVKVRG